MAVFRLSSGARVAPPAPLGRASEQSSGGHHRSATVRGHGGGDMLARNP